MKKSGFSDSQILSVLKQTESGVRVSALCRHSGFHWLQNPQQGIYRSDDPGIVRFDLIHEMIDAPAVLTDQILVEIPGRDALSFGQMPEYRIRLCPPD